MPRTSRLSRTAWHVAYSQRHREDDPSKAIPGRDYLLSLPAALRAEFVAVIKAVADTPPPAFSGGGKWEAMKGPMSGIYQVKANGFIPGVGRVRARLFCLLDRNGSAGLPAVVDRHHWDDEAVSHDVQGQ